MTTYNYIIEESVHRNIYSFYTNVSKKYKHSYSYEYMYKDINKVYDSIYHIENGLLRRKPTISRWNGLFMAHAGKWYFAYRIQGDTICVEDACHAQNMHENATRLSKTELVQIISESVKEVLFEHRPLVKKLMRQYIAATSHAALR